MVPSEQPIDDLEGILFEVLCAIDNGADVEELIARYPGHEEGLRRRLSHLGRLQLDGSMAWSPPTWLGRYRLESVLGRGGMGDVWRAIEKDSGRVVALKFVRGSMLAPSHARRFMREADALRRLNHPGIVGIHDAGEVDGFHFIAMDLLAGRSLDQILRDGPSPEVRSVVSWGRDLALALASAHAEGVVHRDVKPSNIQITPDGHAVLIDFGLTRGLGPSSLSMTGRFVGSPHYAPPEQIRGMHAEVGPAADIYALGVTLYEALCGKVPFDGSSTEQLFHRILTRDPLPIRRHVPSVKPDLEAVILCALEKRPQDRFSTADAFAVDLGAVMDLQPVSVVGPGPVRRLRGWARRRPALAAASSVVAFSLVALMIGFLVTDYRSRLGREHHAREEMAAAEVLFERLVRETRDLPEQLSAFAWQEPEIATSPYSRENVAGLDRLQREIEQSEALREQAFTSVMEHLRRAEELDPTLVGVDRLRARLYLERWSIAKREGAPVMLDFFADRVREYDADGDLVAAVEPMRRITVTSTPPGARVDVFVFRRHDDLVPGGEPRSVPLPIGGAPEGILPGTHALKVHRSSPPLQAEDLIVEVAGFSVEGTVFVGLDSGSEPARLKMVDGVEVFDIGEAEDRLAASADASLLLTMERNGVEMELAWNKALPVDLMSPLSLAEQGGIPVRVWRDGGFLDLVTPSDVVLRPTAAPLLHGVRSFAGITPLVEQPVVGDMLLLLIRAEGYVPVRYPILDHEQVVHVDLDPVGRFPVSFVRSHSSTADLVVMDREVTVGEYSEFLASEPDRKLPMDWTRNPDGTAVAPTEVASSFPVYGMTWKDASAYAAWRSVEARKAGKPYSFSLPDYGQWQNLLRADGYSRRFVWGLHYRSHFTKSCFARHHPRPEPVLRFSVDETIHGLHDTAGGVSEFCSGWFWTERQQRPVYGGSWVNGDSGRFELKYVWGTEEDKAYEYVGFRLALIEDQE